MAIAMTLTILEIEFYCAGQRNSYSPSLLLRIWFDAAWPFLAETEGKEREGKRDKRVTCKRVKNECF